MTTLTISSESDLINIRNVGQGSYTSIVFDDTFSGIIPSGMFTSWQNIISVTFDPLSNVTSINDLAFFNCSGLTVITIPSSVTGINILAFSNCILLNSVTFLGNLVTSIEARVFENCSGLTTITIPSSVTSIGSRAFYHCSSLESITIPSSVTSIGGNAFSDCSSLESITIPSSVTSIGGSAFSYCSSLESITIPSNVTIIESGTFLNCVSLESITIPSNVTIIGINAFSGCILLNSVTFLGNLVTIIEQAIFYNCSSLTAITIPASVITIKFNAFRRCYNLASITIPSSVITIEDAAFSNCSGLTAITIPDSVTSIGEETFEGCSLLTSVTNIDPNICATSFSNSFPTYASFSTITLKSTITSIPDYAFQNCSSLTAITIPDSVTSIGDYAFSNCSSLTAITIPDSVTSIGDNAFDGSNLLYIYVYNSNSKININNLSGFSLEQIIILYTITFDANGGTRTMVNQSASSSTPITPNAFIKSGYTFGGWATSSGSSTIAYGNNVNYLFDANITLYAIWNSIFILTISSGSDLASIQQSGQGSYTFIIFDDTFSGNIPSRMFYNWQNIISVTFDPLSNVTSIEDEAFSMCINLEFITIPSSVTSIGYNAFGNCDLLNSVTFLGNLVTIIGNFAFNSCLSLESITIPSSVTSIGANAFFECILLNSVTFLGNLVTSIKSETFQNCSSLTSITIPSSVTSIERETFSGCSSLASITIPSSVTSIGAWAFQSCYNLASITIPPGVTIGNAAFGGCLYVKTLPITNWYSISITKKSDSSLIFNGYIGVSSDGYIASFLNSIDLTTNILAFTSDDYGADTMFVDGEFTSDGTAITNIPNLNSAYPDATEWSIFNNGVSYKIGFENWIELYDFVAVTTLTTSPFDNIPTTYTITFDANGGTGTMNNQSESSSTPITPNSFIKSGYTFGGWATSSGSSTIAYGNNVNYLFDANITLYAIWTPSPPTPVACFNQNTQILCLDVDTKEDKYVLIQDLRKGDLVKTHLHEYKAIDMIGFSKMYHPTIKKSSLFKYTKEKYPELIEDLIITGCHSVLVDTITQEQSQNMIEILGKIYITDNKYRLIACVDNTATLYEESGIFTIWHIALENKDYYSNYGIWANGLLVETCSKRYLKELSGMTLI